MRKIIIKSFLLLLFSSSSFSQAEADKIEVLIVDGFSNHNWQQNTMLVKTILENSGLFHVSISTSPSEPGDPGWQTWRPKFEEFDVVIQTSNNIQNKEIRWPKKVEKSLEAYVKSGGGLYVLHSANNAFAAWPEYNLMIGLGWRSPEEGIALQVMENGQIKEIPVGEGKKTYHGPRNDEVISILNDHPINKGLPKAWLTPDMELYKFARGPAKNLTVLSYAKDEETNINWPVEWTVVYGKGRVYNSSMGHLWIDQIYPESYQCVGFQTTLIRATEWLATGLTSYEVPSNFPTESEISLIDIEFKEN
jgi:type 1 glutamine amidotransferase